MRQRKAYYTVFALKDKTVLAALQTRKPVGPREGPKPKPDPEGVHTWYVEKADDFQHLSEVQTAGRHTTIATCLNVRRIVREEVETRLDRIERVLGEIGRQLNRIEDRLTDTPV